MHFGSGCHRLRSNARFREILALTPTIAIGGIAAASSAGLVGPGLYHLNVVVPSTVMLCQDALVVGLSGDFETQPNAFRTIAAR
jgi:hypothetical protein